MLRSVNGNRNRWGKFVSSCIHRLKFGPLIGRSAVAKCTACKWYGGFEVLSLFRLSHQVGREGLDSRRKGREIALADDQHPTVRHLNHISVDIYQYSVITGTAFLSMAFQS
jgi:hypothetical protein